MTESVRQYRLPVSTVLLGCVLLFTLALPGSGSYRAGFFILFAIYCVLVKMQQLDINSIPFLSVFWGISFLAVAFLSQLWANYPAGVRETWTNALWAVLVNVSVVMYVTSKRLTVQDVSRLLVPIALIFIGNTLLNGVFSKGYRLTTDVNQNLYGSIASGLACFMLYACKSRRWKSLLYDVLLLSLVVIALLTGSRKALISLIVYYTAIVFFEHPSKQRLLVFFKIIGAVSFFGALFLILMQLDWFYQSIGSRIVSLVQLAFLGTQVDGSAITRTNMITSALEFFRQKPFIGYGLNNFKYISRFSVYSHNNYTELLVSVGVIGTLVYYTPFLVFFFRSVKRWAARAQGAVVPLCYFLAFFFNEFAQVSYFNIVLHVFLGICIGVVYNLAESNQKQSFSSINLNGAKQI